ncbi:MAG: ERF family protein [Acidobacteria bacterium]|nr:ERF family protein [Acidobacteriota bacterium]
MGDNPSELDKLAPALVALQADLKPVEKSADNPFFKSKYAPLPEVMKAVQPLLAKHKLAVSQFVTNINGQSAIRTILLHESGQHIEDVAPLLVFEKTNTQTGEVKPPTPQEQGSAITYARRYGVMAVLGLVADEDDDGNAASSPASPRPVASSSKPASEKQLNLIAQLASKAGYDHDWVFDTHEKVKTSADASAVIEKLQAKLKGGDES